MTRRTVHHVIAEATKAAASSFRSIPHMICHPASFYLANAGQDTRAIQLYLGHKNIQHTVRYMERPPVDLRIFGKIEQVRGSQNG
jgi:site-specific recombinase XerD